MVEAVVVTRRIRWGRTGGVEHMPASDEKFRPLLGEVGNEDPAKTAGRATLVAALILAGT